MRELKTKQERLLWEMAKYKEYEAMLDVPQLAFFFNEFIKQALLDEKEKARLTNTEAGHAT